MRIFIKTSRWAIWARRLGSLCLPLAILPVLLHREQMIDSAAFFAVVIVAAVIACITVCVALVALGRLWFTGDQGWTRAILGLLLGLLCLAPFVYYANLAMRYPPVTDIATTDRLQLPLLLGPDTLDMPPPRLLTDAQRQAVFPNVATRTYPLGVAQLFAIVDDMVAEQGWEVRLHQAPEDTTGSGRINGRIVTLLGYREEAVIRVSPTDSGAAVDMRSASINAVTDFGSNGRRISAFLVDLDNRVTDFLRDNPNLDQAIEAEEPASDDLAPSEDGSAN
ncbi:DUF1499 domain-containing protein [Devosia sp. PTR5]|uniref:DUF1499 domain-containing protein n=1 Tax=Devosia oryzisoli TaxID=2774138 RepID=A0A927FST4_9HYPH|nr:DUF1499 domain-containing protein [Devosia oryzisoli]